MIIVFDECFNYANYIFISPAHSFSSTPMPPKYFTVVFALRVFAILATAFLKLLLIVCVCVCSYEDDSCVVYLIDYLDKSFN